MFKHILLSTLTIFFMIGCVSDLNDETQAKEDTPLKTPDGTIYLSCENYRIEHHGKGLVIYDTTDAVIARHIRKKMMRKISGGTRDEKPNCSDKIPIVTGDSYGQLLPNGKLFANRFFENSFGPYKNVLAFRENGKWGLIGLEGNIIEPAIHEKLSWYGEGKFKVESDGAVFLMDKHGKRSSIEDDPHYSVKHKRRFTPRWAYLSCSDNTKRDLKNGKWGIVDDKGEIVIPHKYRAITCMYEGKALAAIDEYKLWCRVDETENKPNQSDCIDYSQRKNTTYYPTMHNHHWPEKLTDDAYESSVLWNSKYLKFGAGLTSEPPRYMPDGFDGQGIIFAEPHYKEKWD